MSRFDLMFVMQDIHDVATDNRVAEHIVSQHRFRDVETVQLSTLDLQRYIRLARTFKPKLTESARARLVQCYKKLREDRTFVRGACGVTVRQLESLIRLSEAVARVYLEEKVNDDHVMEAFQLQMNSRKGVERENIDLGEDEPQGAAGEGANAVAGDDAPAQQVGGDRPLRRKMKIPFNEYQRIGQMLAGHLAREAEAGQEVKEEDLTNWYMEQVEEEIQTEAQLYEQQTKVQHIINRMINKDRVIVVARASDDPLRPEARVLTKHPNFHVGEDISGARHGR
jgi:DNA replication licensing factor MCM6